MSPTDPRRRIALRTLLSLGAVLAVPAVPTAAAGESTRRDDVLGSRETFVASVDRIVDGRFVVLLFEMDGQVVDQLVVPREELPGVEESDVLRIVVGDGELLDAEPLEEETERRRNRAEERLERLSEA